MKDSKGREYHGWAMQYGDGTVQTWSVERTRSEVLDDYQLSSETRRQVRRRLRNWGWKIVKVRVEAA